MIENKSDFIRANTRLLCAPHVPEISLHLADDAVALWQMTEDQLGQIGLAPPFWAFAWAGGQALARYILDNPQIIRNQTILDVASGSGLVAIAAMHAGAASALACDIDPFATHAAMLNAAHNRVVIDAITCDPLNSPTLCSVILVGDLFYDRDIAARLLSWLRLQSSLGKTVLVGDPGRSYFPVDAFEVCATYEVPVTRALEDAEVKRTRVWRLKGR